MSKKKDGGRFPEVDNPTAAYPIGTLGGGEPRRLVPPSRAPDESISDPGVDDESELDEEDTFEIEDDGPEDLGDEADDTDEYETATFWAPSSTGGVHPAFLVLSLIGGGALALAVVAVIGLFLLLG